ncbi:MAG: hypothetical protein JST93_30405 [Acidobacteria bacterium]|nr:hypothetical protein [Acidobacteriota bacterium]
MLQGMMLAALLLSALPATAQVRPMRTDEIPEPIRREGWLSEINAATAQRLRDGEWDHVIFYALQSQRFTTLAPIEPARSAKAFHDSSAIPPDAAKRLEAFFDAKPQAERYQRMRRMVQSLAQLRTEYQRAMSFLYEKEWASRARQGASRRDFIATLYQTRGHSTDTELRATYGVHIGLSLLPTPEKKIRRVLLIGPGLDWAPRTALKEDTPPQSYQPYALADSLIRLGLATPDSLTIDCIDINPRVIEHINAFAASPRRLSLLYAHGDADWNSYFDKLGDTAGRREGAIYTVHKAIAENIRALRMNLLTERLTETYDLAIATNVLLYFNDNELGLAFANIALALKPGGYLFHNDLRPAIEQWAQSLQLPAIHARTVRLDPSRELYDGVVLHQRSE